MNCSKSYLSLLTIAILLSFSGINAAEATSTKKKDVPARMKERKRQRETFLKSNTPQATSKTPVVDDSNHDKNRGDDDAEDISPPPGDTDSSTDFDADFDTDFTGSDAVSGLIKTAKTEQREKAEKDRDSDLDGEGRLDYAMNASEDDGTDAFVVAEAEDDGSCIDVDNADTETKNAIHHYIDRYFSTAAVTNGIAWMRKEQISEDNESEALRDITDAIRHLTSKNSNDFAKAAEGRKSVTIDKQLILDVETMVETRRRLVVTSFLLRKKDGVQISESTLHSANSASLDCHNHRLKTLARCFAFIQSGFVRTEKTRELAFKRSLAPEKMDSRLFDCSPQAIFDQMLDLEKTSTELEAD